MKYGDFATLVQLGVGLHLGTALLQLYGEIGMQPLMRTIARIKSLVDDTDEEQKLLVGELAEIEGDIDIFRIRLFNQYKSYYQANAIVALVLVALLIFISYNVETSIPDQFSIVVVAFAVLPASVTVIALWLDASKQIKPLKVRADDLERRALKVRTR